MADVIQNLIHSVLDDGARASKFGCIILLPPEIENQDTLALDILCKVATIPGRSIDVIDFKHRGKSIPVPSQEKFAQSLDVSFYLEENHNSRIMFEKWINGLTIDNYASSVFPETRAVSQTFGLVNQLVLHQLDFEGEKQMAVYTFYNVFPKEISAIGVDSSQVDTLLEYTVSFSYSHYEVYSVTHAASGGDLANQILNGVQKAINKVVSGAIGAVSESLGLGGVTKSIGSAIESGAKTINSSLSKVGSSISEFLG